MRNFLAILVSLIIFSACHEPSSIKVTNRLPKAVIKNVEWGGMPIASQIMPGETSTTIHIYNDSYYDIKLPDSYPLKFYIDLNGDKVYVQTRMSYRLGKEEDIEIIVSDTTNVFNPLIE